MEKCAPSRFVHIGRVQILLVLRVDVGILNVDSLHIVVTVLLKLSVDKQ